jgi:hypothetical protein
VYHTNHFIYRKSFSKHLHNLAVSGFYTRELDADDFEFLEQVKRRGIANGDLPNTNTVLVEELEFWCLPYALSPNIERRVGRKPRVGPTVEQMAARQAATEARRELRAVRAQYKAIADAELERERIEFEKAARTRKLRELLTDAEWDAAAPYKNKIGKTVKRHHVPQWKLDHEKTEKAAERNRKTLLIEKQRVRAAQRLQQYEQEQMESRITPVYEPPATKPETQYTGAELASLDARKVAADAVLRAQMQARHISIPYTREYLKRSILMLMRGSAPYVWSVDNMARSLYCDDRPLLDACLDELVAEGAIRLNQ